MTEAKPFVPVWEKAALTFEKASAYTGIGVNRLRELAKEQTSSPMFLRVGTKSLLKRKQLESFIDRASVL